MKATITYYEISEAIEKRFKLRPKFTTIDNKSVEVSYKPNLLVPTIAINFHIDAMRSDVICLSYECSNAASLIIAGVVAYLEDAIPNGVEVNTTDKRINIYPQQIKQAEKVLKYVSLSNISFEEKAICVELAMA